VCSSVFHFCDIIFCFILESVVDREFNPGVVKPKAMQLILGARECLPPIAYSTKQTLTDGVGIL
jgi:hypothetical protein